jgi:hypothetical protein
MSQEVRLLVLLKDSIGTDNQRVIHTLGDMPLDYTYQEVIHMKVSHLTLIQHELMSSCIVRYSVVVIHGGADWVASIRLIFGMEWGRSLEEVRDLAR